MSFVKTAMKAALNSLGLEVRRKSAALPVEFTKEERDIVNHVTQNNLSMATSERLWTTLMACKYAVQENIEGDFVECGVWRGGNALIAAAVFRLYGANRKVYLFDTYEGMTTPTDKDTQASDGASAADEFLKNQKETHNDWCYASIEDVKNNFDRYGLLGSNSVFVKGDVCATLDIQKNLPERICVLRLDTDWYESTKKELEVLYPRLSIGGALILDDYGHWAGAKEATDEYFKVHGHRPFLQYTDYTGRVAVKTR